MDFWLYGAILKRYWLPVALVPLFVLIISLLVALARPPLYGVSVRLLVTRGAFVEESMAGLTEAREDKTAQDLPAIISGVPFRRDLAAELARRGQPMDEATLAGALQAGHHEHQVFVAVAAAQPDHALLIAQALIDLIQTNGLRYWNEPRATPEQPGLNVAVLDPPEHATRLNGGRAIVMEVGLRTLTGALAGAGLAFGAHYLGMGRRHADRRQIRHTPISENREPYTNNQTV